MDTGATPRNPAMDVEMPGLTIYECSRGMVFVFGEEVGVKVFSNVRMQPGAEPRNKIAICECFHLAGQGTTEEEAINCLSTVLSNHLYSLLQRGLLSKALRHPTWRVRKGTLTDLSAGLTQIGKLVQQGQIVSASADAPPPPNQSPVAPAGSHVGV